MVSWLSEKKTWVGSLVVSEQSAKAIGYVKEIYSEAKNEAETVVVSPIPILWLPQSITGVCTFSSEAVVGAGDGCLIVSESIDVEFNQQSDFGKTLCKHAVALLRVTTGAIPGLLVILLSLLEGIVSLVTFISSKIFERPIAQDSLYPSSFDGDDDDDTGRAPMREPRSPGPLPTDHESMALPLVDTQRDTETYPMTQLIVPTIIQPDS